MPNFDSNPKRRALFDLLLREAGLEPFSTSGIKPRKRGDSVPLSFTQQQMWYLNELVPQNPFYNIPAVLHLKGPLDITALQLSFDQIVQRHESLRTTFIAEDGVPVQLISPNYKISLPLLDLTRIPETDRMKEAQVFASSEARRPFDLTKGPLLRTALLRLGEKEHVLLIVSHHIVTDGSSWAVFFRELDALYRAFCEGTSSPLPDLPIQYADFVDWQRERLRGDLLEQNLSYWKKQLHRAPELLELPIDRPRPAAQTFRGKRHLLVLSGDLTDQLRSLSGREGTTIFMTLLAAYQAMLSRITGQNDIVVGSPVEGRSRPELDKLIGLFLNTLVLRTDLSGNPSFRELLRRERDIVVGALAHQEVPFEKLIGELRSVRSLDRNTLFQTMLNFRQQAIGENLKLYGLEVKKLSVPLGVAKFDLLVSIIETKNNLRCAFTCNTDLFEPGTITRIATQFQILLEGIVRAPDRRISELPLLPEAERHQLLVAWNASKKDYPKEQCIHQLFECQAAKAPESTAVTFDEERLSYRELNQRANQVAHYLRSLGVRPGVLVGICLERSLELMVGLLGILKAGGAYVPLDPNYPSERLAFILEDAQARVLLTQKKFIGALFETMNPGDSIPTIQNQISKTCPEPSRRVENPTVVCLDTDWENISQESEENPVVSINGEDLAYVIYTSGSTGRPKGAEITHRALVNFVQHTGEAFGLSGRDRVLQFASIGFDTAAEEIFPCLSRGATLVLRTECMIDSVPVFLQNCAEWGVTVLDLPTVYWHELTERLYSEKLALSEPLRLVIIGGEKAIPERLVQWQETVGDRVRLLNTYGPTEATVVATTWEANGANPIAESPRQVPIGRPISNVQTYILDKYLNPVPIGVRGELHIGGEGIARGYLNCPDLTAERFIPDPFSPVSGARLYKTGDRARYLADGNIEFIGRMDHQVKIRGFRIELGEIEAALAQHPAVRETVVTAKEEVDVTGGGGEHQEPKTGTEPSRSIENPKSLAAYVVTNPEQAPTVNELRDFVKKKLPNYMIPSAFVFLDSLPLTPNGKVDRKALPNPDEMRATLHSVPVLPSDTLELELTKIWGKILQLNAVQVRDNFFDLGGHSLLAVRLFAEIEKTLGKHVPLATIFQAPTIEQLAQILRQEELAKTHDLWSAYPFSVVPFQPHGSKPPFFWFNWGPWDFRLPRYLGSDQPVYGLQHQSQNGHRARYTSIESMAAHYIQEIRTVQAKGPYFLGGLCIAGMVAFEMARQLQKQGDKVALLVLLDPTPPRSSQSFSVSRGIPRVSSQLTGLRNKIFRHLHELAPLGPQDQVSYALVRVQNRIMGLRAKTSWRARRFLCEVFEIPLPPSLRTLYISSIYGRAAREYIPQVYRGRAILFKTQGQYRNVQSRWENLVAGSFEIQELDTDHDNVFKEPYVRIFAEKLKIHLVDVQSDRR
jgi:aspartate racemase